MIMCDEFIEKIIPINFNEKKATRKTKNFYILLECLLPTIVIIIYCYLVKYRTKQNHLLPFHDINNELKQRHLFPSHDTN